MANAYPYNTNNGERLAIQYVPPLLKLIIGDGGGFLNGTAPSSKIFRRDDKRSPSSRSHHVHERTAADRSRKAKVACPSVVRSRRLIVYDGYVYYA